MSSPYRFIEAIMGMVTPFSCLYPRCWAARVTLTGCLLSWSQIFLVAVSASENVKEG